MASLDGARERILATYRDRTKRSRELFEQAGQVLEGDTTRTSVFFAPYPCYVAEGRGARITDVDGNVRIIHFTAEPLDSYRAVARGDRARASLLALALMNRGVFLASRGMGCISSVMTGAEVNAFLGALEGALVEDLELGGGA